MNTSSTSATTLSFPSPLLELRQRLEADRQELHDALNECLSLLENESAPGGTDVNFREEHEAVAKQHRETISAIEAALERMDAGIYGTCGKCQSAIPVERLEVVPATTTCVACQSGTSSRISP